MTTEERLEIAGYVGTSIPCTFIRQDGPTTRLAILLPGFRYTCEMPLLYYSELLLLERGYDVLRVELVYSRVPNFLDQSSAERSERLGADASAIVRVGLVQRQYSDLVIVGKSIGTRSLGHILTTEPLPEETRAVWLTPLLKDETLRDRLRRDDTPSLIVAGDADPLHDPAFLDELATRDNVTSLVIHGGDHDLHVGADALVSLDALHDILAALAAFIPPSAPPAR